MFSKLFQPYANAGLLFIRLGLGLMFIFVHGEPKLSGGPEQWEKLGQVMQNLGIYFYPVFWGFMSTFAETVGGFCLLFGLFFRPALLLLVINLSVATVMHLSMGQGIDVASHAIEDAIVFAGLFVTGPGKYSLVVPSLRRTGSHGFLAHHPGLVHMLR